MKIPLLFATFLVSVSQLEAAAVFWSFESSVDGTGASRSAFTSNDGFAGTPSVALFSNNSPGPSASFGNGGASYTYNGTTYVGSGNGNTPGHSMIWGTSQSPGGTTGTLPLAGIGFTVTLNTLGLTDLAMRFDIRSATGSTARATPPSKFASIEYSLDGGAVWQTTTALTALATASGWNADAGVPFEQEAINFSGITELNNQSNLRLRFTFADGTVPTLDVTQNVRVDNLLITAVPEPASISLLGLGAAGLVIRRRRSA